MIAEGILDSILSLHNSNNVNKLEEFKTGVFDEFFYPFLTYFDVELKNFFKKINKYKIQLDEENIAIMSLQHLRFNLIKASAKVLVTELNTKRELNLLMGNDSRERYKDFMRIISDKREIKNILLRYPVLENIIINKMLNFLKLIQECLTRLLNDSSKLENELNIKINNIKNLEFSLGDSHNGGKSVVVFVINNDKKIVYKPRKATPEMVFNTIINWINNKNILKEDLKYIRTIECKDYQWQEYIKYEESENIFDIEVFHFRIGALLAILNVLNSGDIHYENLISRKDCPYVIDLETLLTNKKIEIKEFKLEVMEHINNSVFGTMLIPSNLMLSNSDVDMSGLTGDCGKQSYKTIVHDIVNIGTDQMRFEPVFASTSEHKNRLKINGHKIDSTKYLSYIEEGFSTCYDIFLEYKDEFMEMVKSNNIFKGEYRQVLRPTQIYSNFLEASYHPKYLNDFNKRRKLFNLLKGSNTNTDKKLESEVDALMNDDIPYFSNDFDSKSIICNKNVEIDGFFQETLRDILVKRIEEISEEKKRIELKYIRMSLLSNNSKYNNYPITMDLQLKDIDYSPLDFAKIIAEDIIKNLIWNKDKTMCSILNPISFENYEYRLAPMNENLYEGGGIVHFFACLYKETNDIRYKNIVDAMLLGIEEIYIKTKSNMSISIFNGSMVYLYYNLFSMFNDDRMYDKFKSAVDEMINIDIYESDINLDVVGGISGTIICCINIYNKTNYKPLLKIIKRYGEILYKRLSFNKKNILTGFAHGYSGYSLALIKLGEFENNFKYIALGKELIEIEDQYYNRDQNNWLDLRKKNNECLYYWCHGGAGIGLSRALLNEEILSKEIREVINIDIKNSIKYFKRKDLDSNHCLCHGESGNIDCFYKISELLGDDELKKVVYIKAKLLYEDIQKNGFKYDNSNAYGSVSFMIGTSGVGYLFLRLLNPKYPCVLALDVY